MGTLREFSISSCLNLRFSDNDLQKITIVLSLKILDLNKMLVLFMRKKVDQLKTCCSINLIFIRDCVKCCFQIDPRN